MWLCGCRKVHLSILSKFSVLRIYLSEEALARSEPHCTPLLSLLNFGLQNLFAPALLLLLYIYAPRGHGRGRGRAAAAASSGAAANAIFSSLASISSPSSGE